MKTEGGPYEHSANKARGSGRTLRVHDHALEEMDDDALNEEDVREVLLRGSQVAELTDDLRGARFVLRGTQKEEELQVEVVCRFLPSGLMRIITAYVVESSK